jgi:ubiquinone/menaquinone biosynthesis C-methylase UbiE
LEHAYNPSAVVNEFYRILKKGGLLKIVLPYPDTIRDNEEAHGGKYELGTYIEDKGETVTKFFNKYGFILVQKKFDDFREPEIWLTFKK